MRIHTVCVLAQLTAAALLLPAAAPAGADQRPGEDLALVMEVLVRVSESEEWAIGQLGYTEKITEGSSWSQRLVLEYDRRTQRSRGSVRQGLVTLYGQIHNGRGSAWTSIWQVEPDPRLRRRALQVAGRSGASWVGLAQADDVPSALRSMSPTELVQARLSKPQLVTHARRSESGDGRVSYTMSAVNEGVRERVTVDFQNRALVGLHVEAAHPSDNYSAEFSYGPVDIELPSRSDSVPERLFQLARYSVIAPIAIRESARFVRRKAERAVARGAEPVEAIREVPQDPAGFWRIWGYVRLAPRGITIYYRNRFGRWATTVRWNPREGRIEIVRLA